MFYTNSSRDLSNNVKYYKHLRLRFNLKIIYLEISKS
jgi:hypothetical protein